MNKEKKWKYEKTIDGITYCDDRTFWLTDVENMVPLISKDGGILEDDFGIVRAVRVTVTRSFIPYGEDSYEKGQIQQDALAKLFEDMKLLEHTANVHATLEECNDWLTFILVTIAADADHSKMYMSGQLRIRHTEHSPDVTNQKRRPFYQKIETLCPGDYGAACSQMASMCYVQEQSTGVFLVTEDFSQYYWMCPCPVLLVGSAPKKNFTDFLMSR